jgi:hypothetical protein
VSDKSVLILSHHSKDPSYLPQYDAVTCATATEVLFLPMTNAKDEVIFVFQLIDRLDPSGSVVRPSSDDCLVSEFLSVTFNGSPGRSLPHPR